MPLVRSVHFKSTLILLGALFFFSGACQTLDDQEERLSGHFSLEQLQADFIELRNALESNHPDPFRYESAAALDNLFDAAYGALSDDMTEGELYRLVAPLVVRYHCGHTQVTPSNRFVSAMPASAAVLPLGIYLAAGKAYVDADYGSGSGIALGSEILSINQETTASVVERLKAGISSDALNPSHKIFILNRHFYLYYYYFSAETPHFDLTIKNSHTGDESPVRVNARPYSQVRSAVMSRFPGSSRLALDMDGDLAVLTVPTFVTSENPDYRDFFEDAFSRMNAGGVKRLIIDIRGNGGGAPEVSAALIAHLADRPFVYFKTGAGYDYLKRETPPHAVHFGGKVMALIDGGCFSTSGHFCALARHLSLAQFVGETGGGTYRCHDNSTEIVLAHTGMRLRVARTTYEAAVPDQDVSEGFPPDFRVYPGIGDILAGRDVQMEFAKIRSSEAD